MELRNLLGYGLVFCGTVMLFISPDRFDLIKPQARTSTKQTSSIAIFIRRFLGYVGLSALLIFLGLVLGIIGYHWTAGLSWLDALVEASMILSGMGPISTPSTTGAKVFASLYALFSGLIFVIAMGIVLSPLIYSLLSQFQINLESKKK